MPSLKSNPYSDLIGIMRQQGAAYNPPTLSLAEVITPPPNLQIKMGDIVLDKDFLLIADYLLPDYQRAYYMEGVMHAEYTGNFAITDTVSDGGYQASSHSHNVKNLNVTTQKDKFSVHGDGNDPPVNDGTATDKYLTFKDTLKVGDLLAVMPIDNNQQFIILNRLRRL